MFLFIYRKISTAKEMKTHSSGNQSIRKVFSKLTFLSLVQAICIAESCRSSPNDAGQLSWSFPEVRSPRYQERLQLAGRALAQNENLSHRGQIIAAEGQLASLLRAIESFLSLSSRHNSQSISNGLNSNDNAIQRDVVLRSALASMEGVAESGAVSSRCINDTGYLLVSMFQRQGWALKCELGFHVSLGKKELNKAINHKYYFKKALPHNSGLCLFVSVFLLVLKIGVVDRDVSFE